MIIFPFKYYRRYQIFLGGNLTDKFLNIGDGDGNGEDHCELVGGKEMDAVLPGTNISAPALTGKLCLSQTKGIEALYISCLLDFCRVNNQVLKRMTLYERKPIPCSQ